MNKYYRELMDLPGVAGHERLVRAYMEEKMKGLADEIVTDNLGGIWAIKHGPKDAPVVMIAGHMDEVGACVAGIKDNGLLQIKALGGVAADVFASQHMTVVTDAGEEIPGITGTVPPHLKKEGQTAASFDDLTLDIGASNKEEVRSWGIQIGDMIAPKNNFTETKDGNRIISKAVDNRWGCGMVLELLEDLKDVELNCTLVAGANVQEELGLRGATISTYKFNPDVFIALDSSPAGDILGLDNGKLGGGYLLRYLDRVAIMHRGMKKWFVRLSEQNTIPYQYFYSAGGTDAGNAQYARDGVLVATIGLPARYIHSTTSMFDKRDHEAAKQVLRALVKDLDKTTLLQIKKDV